ncbi:MAG: glutaminyl-peptide cyclotransferase [Chitinophagaceae bacterium]|nr:glutaminyl-peptide cyclotransferase [Chitinophagaceae bacterium]
MNWYMLKTSTLFVLSAIILWSCNGGNDPEDQGAQPGQPVNHIPAPAPLTYSVVNIYPHDTAAFTQGLVYYNDQMYEGTGQKKESSLRKVDYKTGKIEKRIDLESTLFGEGITILNDTIYQLTWQDHIVLVYSLKNMKEVRKQYWPNEGWGITHDGTNLIISDGTDKLYFVRPGDFKLLNIVSVSNNNGPVYKLNELEYIGGYIFANQWETDNILKIDPNSGFVAGVMDFKDALKKLANINYDKQAIEDGAVLNGIAWDAATGKMFVTGKRWPKLLEIKLN